MLNNIVEKIKTNKDYLIGLGGIIIVTLVTIMIIYNKTIVNYDGWYNLYAEDILNGKKPYTDFHFLMPPVFLYVWTFLQKIFGDTVIVSHGASMACKTILLGTLYHTLTRFFNVKISFISSILALAVMMTVIFDNCTFSYNEFVTLLIVIHINILLSFTEHLYQNCIKYRYIVLLAIFNTLIFFTKQTHGLLIPLASLIILATILYGKITIKNFLKIAAAYIGSSILTTICILLPLLSNFTLSAYIENVYASASAKGSISDILHVPLNILARYDYLWPILTFGITAFLFFIIKKYNICKFTTGDKNTESEWIPNNVFSIFLCLIVLACSYVITLKLSQVYLLNKIVKNIEHITNQIGCICILVTFFLAIFYYLKTLIIKNEVKTAKRLILYGIFFTTAFSAILSTTAPYFTYYIYGILIATLMNYRFVCTKVINILIYIIIIADLGLSLCSKMSSPIIFHGWQGLNITTERKISKLPFLKGMKLSKVEVDVYEDIYNTLDKYLKKDDKIFAFINNQVFYKLLNRQPFYNDNYSTYWDVCSENCAKDVYGKFNVEDLSKLPPAVIYLQYPDSSISFHEQLFRHGNKDNAQRKIDIKIKNDIKNNRYKVVKTYNYKKYYMNNDSLKEDFKKLNDYSEYSKKLWKNYDYTKIEDLETWNKYIKVEKEQKSLEKQFKKNLNDVNSRFFIENGYELKVLIRKDLYFEVKQ